MIGIESNEGDAIVIAFLLVIPAFFIDRAVTRQRAHEAQLQTEQLRALRAPLLMALGNRAVFAEKPMESGPGLDVGAEADVRAEC